MGGGSYGAVTGILAAVIHRTFMDRAAKLEGQLLSYERTVGDEFVVILPQTNRIGASRCAERIRTHLEEAPIDGKYAVTISGGVVEYQRGETIPELMERAEDRMSLARTDGGNQIAGGNYEPATRADVIHLRGLKT